MAASALVRLRALRERTASVEGRFVTTLAPLALGATVPAIALLAYLGSEHALADFWRDAVLFNLHYVSINARTPLETIDRLATLLGKWNRGELLLLVPAVVGALKLDRRFPDGLTTATLLYTGLVFVSVQAWPDTILLGPGLAATLAIGLSALGRRFLPRLGPVALLAIALASLASPRSSRFFPPLTFAEQREAYRALAADVRPGDSVFVVSAPEFLIHTGRHNVLPWPYMWFGVDRFAAEFSAGGFDGVIARLEQADPRLMIVCRRWAGPLRKRFEEWAAARYTRDSVAIYPHVSRPMAVYRRSK